MTSRLSPGLVRADFAAALSLLTRLPVRLRPETAVRGAASAWCHPLVGALVGLLAGGALATAALAGLPPTVSAAVALSVSIAVTGALHEDGLADTADGFWGGWSPERRLEIMKDSRTGVYGVLALVLSLLLRWSLLAALLAPGPAAAVATLVASGALSRAAMAGVWASLVPARRDGLSQSYGRPGRATAAIGAAVGLGTALLLLPPVAALCAAVAAAASAVWMGWMAHRRIGGQTGDVLGATQQCAEIAVLLTLTVLMP
jgi:adenosylcobinamide-GDP ribazoletransferase